MLYSERGCFRLHLFRTPRPRNAAVHGLTSCKVALNIAHGVQVFIPFNNLGVECLISPQATTVVSSPLSNSAEFAKRKKRQRKTGPLFFLVLCNFHIYLKVSTNFVGGELSIRLQKIAHRSTNHNFQHTTTCKTGNQPRAISECTKINTNLPRLFLQGSVH